jgi:HEAT repeat protein
LQAAAAAALSNLSTMTSIKQLIGTTPEATSSLAKLLTSSSKEVQHSAATALSNLAAGSPANKTSILRCSESLAGLSKLLSSSDEAVQRAAATALCNLSSAIIASKCWYMDLAAAGGLAALQNLAGSEDGKSCKWVKGNAEVQAAAAAALRRLCKVGKITL